MVLPFIFLSRLTIHNTLAPTAFFRHTRQKRQLCSPGDRKFSRFFRGDEVQFLKIFLTVVGPSFRRIAPPEAVASAGNAYCPPPQGHCAVLMSSCRTWEVSSGAATRLFCGIGVLWLLLPSFHFLSAHPCTSRDRFGSAQAWRPISRAAAGVLATLQG